MIDPHFFYKVLGESGIDFFTGVPDSLLSDFGAFLQENVPKHIIAANEGNAVAIAAGSYLATGKPALVYLQNSGQGNTLNPLISLTDPDVYGIPMILLVGWRGEPGTKDEPQHMKQGAVTTAIFDAIGTPWLILPDNANEMVEEVKKAVKRSIEQKRPVALVVRKGTFSAYRLSDSGESGISLPREEAIIAVTRVLPKDCVVVATTGKISRELDSYRTDSGNLSNRDFLTVGSMGHASQIALGIALEKKDTQVFCFDGDGAAIMHLGGLAIIGNSGCENFFHIIFNNSAHDSVGGLPTVADRISLSAIAKSCGYKYSVKVESIEAIEKAITGLGGGPGLIEVVVAKGSRENLVRPSSQPRERKKAFMESLGVNNG